MLNPKALRVLDFMAPNMLPAHRYVVETLGEKLGLPTEFIIGEGYTQAAEADLSFICGLPYVLRRDSAQVEAIAAPVLVGGRYQSRPIYFSDVIVHRDSPHQSFTDLRGCSWAYNELESQSGYGITRYHLVQLGEINGFFGEVVVEAAYHQDAIRMVCNEVVDAAAIDSQVLEIELRDHPELVSQLRIIDVLGPSTIQPIVASRRLSDEMKADIQNILTSIHHDPTAESHLGRGLISHFVPMTDADYDDIRAMLAACQRANFLTLR